MKVNNNICLYRHIRLDTNTTFYIGIGEKTRPYDIYKRSNYWKNITNKTDYEIDVLKSDLTWEEACELEIILISFFGRKDIGKGTLCNMTDGGEGSTGIIVSNKTKKKLSKIRKGKKQNSTWINNRAESLRGRNLSVSHKTKLSKAKKGRVSNQAKKVINAETGEIFESILSVLPQVNMKYNAFAAQLRGQNKNVTPFKYLIDYGKN